MALPEGYVAAVESARRLERTVYIGDERSLCGIGESLAAALACDAGAEYKLLYVAASRHYAHGLAAYILRQRGLHVADYLAVVAAAQGQVGEVVAREQPQSVAVYGGGVDLYAACLHPRGVLVEYGLYGGAVGLADVLGHKGGRKAQHDGGACC